MRFSTVDHPQSNGLVERWNGTLKNMLYHAMKDHPRDWDQFLPFLVWSYREVENETLNVSPFEMVYGRIARGPLSLLADVWSGAITEPDTLNTNVSEYITQLRDKMTEASERAKASANVKQKAYTHQYNLRARYKSFEKGDQVIIRNADQRGKMDELWEGPLTIESRARQHTYQVKYPNGRTKWVHADKIRPYYARIASVGVVFEDDEQFGDLAWAPELTSNEKLDLRVEDRNDIGQYERNELRQLVNAFPDVFKKQPGLCRVGKHAIVLKEEFVPKRMAPYRIPMTLRKEVDNQIDDLISLGIIEPATSEYAHPVVCVIKKDSSVRLCVDYRHLNSGTVADTYPMNHPVETLMTVGAARFISLLDLCRGYWQVPLDESCRHMTTFITHRGSYMWRTMPFGLKNSAATFQRIMNLLLSPYRDFAIAYIDDIAIYSKSWEEHKQHLKVILMMLRENGLTVNPNKCKFAQAKVKYLGHIVGSGRHAPDPERVQAIQELQRPTNKKQLRSLLGLCSYYRNYVPAYAEVVKPLTDMTSRRVRDIIPWTEKAECCFQRLKSALSSAAAMCVPNMSRSFRLCTDASQVAVGACLSQVDDDGVEHPIAFASQRLNAAQSRWATIERKAYAIVWALKKFDTWVYGTHVEIVTDHNPLVYLHAAAPSSAKLTRWALSLSRYNFEIKYRQGKLHLNADMLSRI